ncbi:hypothetical protein A6770_21715 [Nostoc minutum NIES-26]|uniref:Uncharacterized protein n=1 Tax=Nostoc minutum NIES-26 TaxID=1844469 RepID=A0A367QZF0_9NOSO|nr:hypothetical protein A6770_21715 [Nostoc minutum NIES-26]
MFTRSELEVMTLQDLKVLCFRYGLKPTGNPGYKTSWITSLMAFPALALQQLEEGRGLKSPSFACVQNLGTCLDEMATPTDEQSALIKISLEGRRIQRYPDKYNQEKLIAIWKAKNHLEQVIDFLSSQ